MSYSERIYWALTLCICFGLGLQGLASMLADAIEDPLGWFRAGGSWMK